MRLFIAAWPPSPVIDALRTLPHPDFAEARWTREENWHVTLRFLGEVGEREAAALPSRLEPVVEAAHAEAGPATTLLNASILAVPVRGLDALAGAVVAATADIGQPPEPRPFRGHITVARARGRAKLPRAMAGAPISCDWPVREIAVVRSVLRPDGADYETIATVTA